MSFECIVALNQVHATFSSKFLRCSASGVSFLVHVFDLEGLVVVLLLDDVLHRVAEARLGEQLVDLFESKTTSLWEEEVLLRAESAHDQIAGIGWTYHDRNPSGVQNSKDNIVLPANIADSWRCDVDNDEIADPIGSSRDGRALLSELQG